MHDIRFRFDEAAAFYGDDAARSDLAPGASERSGEGDTFCIHAQSLYDMRTNVGSASRTRRGPRNRGSMKP